MKAKKQKNKPGKQIISFISLVAIPFPSLPSPLLFFFYLRSCLLYEQSIFPTFRHIKKAKALVCNELKAVNRVFSLFSSVAAQISNSLLPTIISLSSSVSVSVPFLPTFISFTLCVCCTPCIGVACVWDKVKLYIVNSRIFINAHGHDELARKWNYSKGIPVSPLRSLSVSRCFALYLNFQTFSCSRKICFVH